MTKKKRLKLKRELGLWQCTLIGVGVIVGAGIYALVGEAAAEAGNAVWISFLISSLVAMFTALSYAELSSMYPKDSAEYIYCKKPLGKMIAYVVAFMILIGTIIAASAVSLGFGGYLAKLVPLNVIVLAAIGLIVFGIIAFWKIEVSSNITIVFSIISIIGLLIIVALGGKYFGKVDYLSMPFGWPGIFSAGALIFFAFLGFEDLVKLSEETKNPRKTIPKALILSITICAVLYILVSVASISVLGYEKLGDSKAPLAAVANQVFGANVSLLLIIIALCATGSTLLMLLIAASRTVYGYANESLLPKMFARVHKKTRTPHIAIIIVTIVSILVALLGDIKSVANVTNFLVFITFIMINLAVIILRYTDPKMKREYKVHGSIGKLPIIPVLGMITCIIMIISMKWIKIRLFDSLYKVHPGVFGLLVILVGLILYWLFGRK